MVADQTDKLPFRSGGLEVALRSFLIAVMVLISAALSYGDSTGVITGFVLDSEDKQPVAGARVIIDGTKMGCMINPVDGSYIIKNIPAGEYTLIASCIGYHQDTTFNVMVNAGITTKIDFELKSEAVKAGKVKTVDGPPVINKYEVSRIVRIYLR